VANLVFCIGGPYGHSMDVRSRANETLKLSDMVLNHQVSAWLHTMCACHPINTSLVLWLSTQCFHPRDVAADCTHGAAGTDISCMDNITWGAIPSLTDAALLVSSSPFRDDEEHRSTMTGLIILLGSFNLVHV